jgi:hypothetical protein
MSPAGRPPSPRSYRAVAAEMGCSPRTVQRVERAALAKLRAAILERRECQARTLELYLLRREAFRAYLSALMRTTPDQTDRLGEPPPAPW